jgi:hypothetical protein
MTQPKNRENHMVRIQQKEYFEQKVLELEELIAGAYPTLWTTSRHIDLDRELISIQAEMRVPGYEGVYFVEWVHYVNEEEADLNYECAVITAEGEELNLVYSNSAVKATTKCMQGVQKMLLATSSWMNETFLHD